MVLDLLPNHSHDRRQVVVLVLCPWCQRHHVTFARLDEPRAHPCRRNLGVVFTIASRPRADVARRELKVVDSR